MRSYLKRFLFADDRIMTQVKKLTGGERSRLLLARILKSGGNFLILDEPTNDLDLPTLRVLEEALIAFPGVVLRRQPRPLFSQPRLHGHPGV